MAKYLDLTGLRALWAKTKAYLGRYVEDSGANSASFHGYPVGDEMESKFAEFVSKPRNAVINYIQDEAETKVFDANVQYTQVSHGANNGVNITDDGTTVNGKVTFGSDNVNFKMSDKSDSFSIDLSNCSSSVKAVTVRKLFNIDNYFSLLCIKVYSNEMNSIYELVDYTAEQVVARFPAVSAHGDTNNGGNYSACILLAYPKKYNGINVDHYIRKAN